MKTEKFVYSDGGRSDAGYKGDASDCVTRSIAIATGKPYQEVYDEINELSKTERITKRKKKKSTAREGVYGRTWKKYIKSLGWEWTPTMFIGSGCKVHLKENELPTGTLIVSVSRHLTTVIDGVIHDVGDPSREGSRCVYGYFKKQDN
jgi:hypothetical protein